MSQHPRPKFTYLGHATVRCDLPGGEVVLIDPWVMNNPACPEGLKSFDRLDAILITHAHSDHMGDAVELAKRHRPGRIIASYDYFGACLHQTQLWIPQLQVLVDFTSKNEHTLAGQWQQFVQHYFVLCF